MALIMQHWARRLGRLATLLAAVLLAGCSVSGQSFNVGGLGQIVVGRTTLAQATDYLGALPDQTWQQGDSLLARWGYKGTLATDAVYVRQEAWLRFGPDGTFQRMENTINIPSTFRPMTQAEADQAAASAAASSTRAATVQANSLVTTPAASSEPTPTPGPLLTSDAAAPAAMGTGAVPQPVTTPQPLLPVGSSYVPGVSYPIGNTHTGS